MDQYANLCFVVHVRSDFPNKLQVKVLHHAWLEESTEKNNKAIVKVN